MQSKLRPQSIHAMLGVGRHSLSIGLVNEVVDRIRLHPRQIEQLVQCLWDDDPGVANRAADALERLTRGHHALLAPWKEPLLGLLLRN